jgi:hypothetical protein
MAGWAAGMGAGLNVCAAPLGCRLSLLVVPMYRVRLKCCHGPSAAWPTFAKRERKKKSATPVGMTEECGD